MTQTIQLSGGVAQIQKGAQGSPSFPAVVSTMIYSAYPYSSFPRVLKLADGSGFLICCKGGQDHEGPGDCKILFSADFVTWTLRATVPAESPANTIMDPIMCQLPDGRVQLVGRHFALNVQPSRNRVHYSSDNGATWTNPAAFGVDEFAYFTQRIGADTYLGAYTYTTGNSTNLYRFTGDTTVELISQISSGDANTEIAFGIGLDGIMVAHVRQGNTGSASNIYTAPAPYTTWTSRGTWYPWHGMVIRKSPTGELWGLGRWFQVPNAVAGNVVTAVLRYDGYTPRVVAYLPPASSVWGHAGYGDLVWIGSKAYPHAVFYSQTAMHETAIYSAIISP